MDNWVCALHKKIDPVDKLIVSLQLKLIEKGWEMLTMQIEKMVDETCDANDLMKIIDVTCDTNDLMKVIDTDEKKI
jgi:hypothetical protein